MPFFNMFMLSINPKKNISWTANENVETTKILRGSRFTEGALQ
jgi:hypothetical protein